MPRFYPLQLDISGKLCVVVGGGSVAERKVNGLLEANAKVRVVSPLLSSALQNLANTNQIEVFVTPYEPSCIEGAVLVIAATNIRNVNKRIAEDAKKSSIQVNSVDCPEESTFIVPSTVRRGEFCLSVSTGGNNPMLSAQVCDVLAKQFGPEYAEYVELLGEIRVYIKTKTEVSQLRRLLLTRVLEAGVELQERIRSGQYQNAMEMAKAIVQESLPDIM